MSDNINKKIEFNEPISNDKNWIHHTKENLINKLKQSDIWTKLTISTTILELFFSKIPFISTPNAILDVGGGFGNLFEKINSKDVMPSDIVGLGNSLVGFVGAFSIGASLGIETTLIGIKLIRIANLTTPIGVGLFALGYILDHRTEIIQYVGNEGYELLKEQYAIAINKFEETKGALKMHLGEALFDAVTDINQANMDKILTTDNNGTLAYNLDYLDPTGSLNLKNKLEISPLNLYNNLHELNSEVNSKISPIFNQDFSLKDEINSSINPFLTENEIKQPQPEEKLQDLFLSLDMSDTNLELIHLTKEDLKNSPLYSIKNSPGITSYSNNNLPWLNESLVFLEVNGKFFLYNQNGINKGLAFPLFYDKTTKLPIGLPLDVNGDFKEMNALDVLEHSPHLFNEPGHIINNMALAIYQMQNTAVQATLITSNLAMTAIQNRLQEVKIIRVEDILKLKNDALESFSKNLPDENLNHPNLSTSSGNSREGKYCFAYDGIDISPIKEYLGDHQKIIVEMCFDRNPYLAQFE